MDFNDIFKLAGAIITSVGGAGLVIAAFSTWLGRVWADRILERDKLKYASELEKLKNQLQSEAQRYQFIFSLYFEGQFKIYNDLWLSLADLQEKADHLWNEPTKDNLVPFAESVRNTKRQIRKSALLLEADHYKEILDHLHILESYVVGKKTLIQLRNVKSTEHVDQDLVEDLINANTTSMQKISHSTNLILEKMRTQIGGGLKQTLSAEGLTKAD